MNLLPFAGTTGSALSSTAWLGFGGILWWIVFPIWIIVFALWGRQLFRYNRTYRKYEQAYRQHEDAHGQQTQELRLAQERLGQFHKDHSVLLKLLSRCGLILGYTDVNGRPCSRNPLNRIPECRGSGHKEAAGPKIQESGQKVITRRKRKQQKYRGMDSRKRQGKSGKQQQEGANQ